MTLTENFNKVIEKAIVACQNSSINYKEHFPDVRKTLEMPNNAMKKIIDYKLSRYACYLIAQNGDSRKEVIALAQTYFAIQTRKQELSEKEYNELSEDEKRLYRRNQARKGNFNLNKTAGNAKSERYSSRKCKERRKTVTYVLCRECCLVGHETFIL